MQSIIESVQTKPREVTEILARCSHCGSTNVYGVSRVVGYYSKIDNWNKSKQAEFRDRQKGNYMI